MKFWPRNIIFQSHVSRRFVEDINLNNQKTGIWWNFIDVFSLSPEDQWKGLAAENCWFPFGNSCPSGTRSTRLENISSKVKPVKVRTTCYLSLAKRIKKVALTLTFILG
jgi:hypothetical protein